MKKILIGLSLGLNPCFLCAAVDLNGPSESLAGESRVPFREARGSWDRTVDGSISPFKNGLTLRHQPQVETPKQEPQASSKNSASVSKKKTPAWLGVLAIAGYGALVGGFWSGVITALTGGAVLAMTGVGALAGAAFVLGYWGLEYAHRKWGW